MGWVFNVVGVVEIATCVPVVILPDIHPYPEQQIFRERMYIVCHAGYLGTNIPEYIGVIYSVELDPVVYNMDFA